MDIKAIDKQYVAPTYARFDLHLVGGNGSILIDETGKEYIDMATGIAVNAFGACDEQWKNAVIAQLNCLQHTSNLYYNTPSAMLAKALCERTGMKKVFFSNSGAEANETAIKAGRKYGELKKGKEYYTVITLKNSFHGRTITTLSATGQDVFHEHFTPMTDGFVHATANDIEDMKRLVKAHKCCAVFIELVQGEGGVTALDREYVKQVEKLAREEDLLLMIDEVQTGNGRTGDLYAFMGYGITPDVVTTAKGLGGGLPIGATMLGQRAETLFAPGLNGSTFGGNPVCTAGALNILQRIDDNLLQEVRAKSAYIFETLQGAKGVKSVSGLGLMIGIESEKDASSIIASCMARGVLVIKAKNKIRLLPALNIPWEQLKTAIEILKEELAK
ncbi:MAG: aminotransferase class III-fold pyridoxal phosphate-dependent enzyme [Clostridia bacterium]|nr:aminotransferase class III-fold pyridoxal phosphate-dependent enzyme [Clostridia bacterium]